MRLHALAAIALAAACGQDSGPDPELEAKVKKREAELAAIAKATQPKPPEPAKPVPPKEQLVADCNAQRDVATCQAACAAPDMESCYQLALVWEEGRGVPKPDFEAAHKFHIRACEGGHAQACMSAAIFYDYGKATPKNPRKAKEFYKKACDLKVEAACKELEKK